MAGKKPSKQKDRKKKKKAGINGFSTLNQVAGVPKPHDKCVYCGKEIENIASAFMAPDGTYAHFDCVLERIRETEKPGEGESVSYIGGGSFGIIGRGEDGKPIIIRRIQYESPETVRSMKAYVASLRD